MLRSLLRCVSVSGAILLLALSARATIVVDAGGGGDVTTLAAAIAAAQDRELSLVKSAADAVPGSGHFVVDGKSLSIVADVGADVTLTTLTVRNVPAGQQVVLRGLTIDQSPDPTPKSTGSLRVEGPGGTVWVEDCTIDAGKGGVLTGLGVFFYPAGPGVVASGGATVLLERCTLRGGEGLDKGSFLADKWNGGPGATAVRAQDSRVVLHDCTLRGGDGGDGEHLFFPAFFPANGGAGLTVTGTSLAHVAGCEVRGGDNGLTDSVEDVPGSAVDMVGLAGSVWARDSAFSTGRLQGDGLPAPLHFPPGAAPMALPSAARTFAVSSPLREGQAGSIEIQGQTGDQALLLVSLNAGAAPMIGKEGVLLLDSELLLLIVPLGTVSAPGGELSVPFVAPPLDPVVSALTVPMQLAVVAGGVVTLEGGSALAWLDAGL
jgi:hypothetical protein